MSERDALAIEAAAVTVAATMIEDARSFSEADAVATLTEHGASAMDIAGIVMVANKEKGAGTRGAVLYKLTWAWVRKND
jgi:hypothetical protein